MRANKIIIYLLLLTLHLRMQKSFVPQSLFVSRSINNLQYITIIFKKCKIFCVNNNLQIDIFAVFSDTDPI